MGKTNLQKSLEKLTDEKLLKEWEGAKNTDLESTYKDELDERKIDVITGRTYKASGTAKDIADIFKKTKEPIPDFHSIEDIDFLRQWESDGIKGISLTPKFKELKPKGYGLDQRELLKEWRDSLSENSPYRNMLQQKIDLIGETGEQISLLKPSSAQYLINQARKGEYDSTDTFLGSGVQVASAGDLRGSGIPGIIERKRQAEKKLREDLGRDTSSQVPTYVDTAQVAAEPTGGGWQPDYAGAVADQQQQAAEAGQTHEQFMSDLDAVMAEGGMVEQRMNPLIKTSQLGIMGLQGYQGGQQNPYVQGGPQGGGRQKPPPGGWPPRSIFDFLGGPKGYPQPRPQSAPWDEFGEQLGGFGETLGGYEETLGGYEEQLGGFGETLGGYGEQIGGFGEQMSGVEEAMGGFGEQFKGLNNRLDSMEKGIASLSDQLQPKQPQFGGYGGYGGYGGFGYRGRYG